MAANDIVACIDNKNQWTESTKIISGRLFTGTKRFELHWQTCGSTNMRSCVQIPVVM